MRQKKETLVVTFATTTQAMAVEKYCLEKGLPGRIIPVPREITAGCGLSWKAAPADRELLTAAFAEAGLGWDEMYVIQI
ncbi:MAG: DUF3343 domain-containing protein [Oscillospiraceae bacterium]|nr:DUF3343 domain-containing protein [Oscillospiraceae bacterium]MBQ9148515.1 DUF3343 domain-containing protein [Oscillospiraceae bacterium]